MRKRRTFGLVAAAALAAATVAVIAATALAGGPGGKLTLAVYGDSPYLGHGLPDAADVPSSTRRRRSSTRSTPTRACRRSCTSATSTRAASPARSVRPVDLRPLDGVRAAAVYTPGDNEWSDCTKAKEEPGSDNDNVDDAPRPAAREPGARPADLLRQPGPDAGPAPDAGDLAGERLRPAHPTTRVRRERHVGAVEDGVRDAQHPGRLEQRHRPLVRQDAHDAVEPGQQTEMDAAHRRRRPLAERGLRAGGGRQRAQRRDHRPVRHVGHGGQRRRTRRTTSRSSPRWPSNATSFGKPVLYLNGDSHVYRSDNPLEQSSTCYTETRRVRRATRGASTRSTTCRTSTGSSCTAARSRWSG